MIQIKIIKEQYNDNKYNSYLSYNRNPDVIQLLYNKFTLFTVVELQEICRAWDIRNPLIVTILEIIAHNQPNTDMGMSSNPKTHDIVKKLIIIVELNMKKVHTTVKENIYQVNLIIQQQIYYLEYVTG